ncbi:hypothetical protein H6F67_23530 [Microcoleus sp. FACHB-1515]|uniref:hypothetical protein n=1 Tax=Cyanophyceae TaxID=3028117 RepID=UPI0016858E16|nr:hypothetical protein [Microcoleus sp. FACHB-1515]MBD2092826.1 hypothetical protein [Microcoleus sp. FACHB-1515]
MGSEHEPHKSNTNELAIEQEAISTAIRILAERHRGDERSLLKILRTLEALHREICEGLFQEALPTNRQALYSFLKDIESEGGWPYIKRMRIQALLVNLLEAEKAQAASSDGNSAKSVE